jgi:hypothetical protein
MTDRRQLEREPLNSREDISGLTEFRYSIEFLKFLPTTALPTAEDYRRFVKEEKLMPVGTPFRVYQDLIRRGPEGILRETKARCDDPTEVHANFEREFEDFKGLNDREKFKEFKRFQEFKEFKEFLEAWLLLAWPLIASKQCDGNVLNLIDGDWSFYFDLHFESKPEDFGSIDMGKVNYRKAAEAIERWYDMAASILRWHRPVSVVSVGLDDDDTDRTRGAPVEEKEQRSTEDDRRAEIRKTDVKRPTSIRTFASRIRAPAPPLPFDPFPAFLSFDISPAQFSVDRRHVATTVENHAYEVSSPSVMNLRPRNRIRAIAPAGGIKKSRKLTCAECGIVKISYTREKKSKSEKWFCEDCIPYAYNKGEKRRIAFLRDAGDDARSMIEEPAV